MYKLLSVLLVLLLTPSLANAWGVLSHCFSRPTGTTKNECFIERFVAAGKTPKLNLIVDDVKNRSGQERDALRSDIQKKVSSAFNDWISRVQSTIANSGRSEEFADLLKTFPQSVPVNLVNSADTKNAGINLTLKVGYERQADAHTCALAYAHLNKIEWFTHILMNFRVYDEDGMPTARAYVLNDCHTNGGHQIIRHEIGHLLGLADLYWHKLESAAEKDQVITSDFSLLPMGISGSEMEKNSVMGAANGKNIGCDDIDALINIYDILHYVNGEESPRWKEGWKSFCPNYQGKFLYAYGQAFRTPEEYKTNKQRIEALKFFKKEFIKWYKEFDVLDAKVRELEVQLEQAKRPLSTADLLNSAKLNYLRDRRNQVGQVYVELDKLKKGTPLLEQYKETQEFLEPYKGIAPGMPMYDLSVLNKYKPSESHLMESVAQKPHVCLVCGKTIPAGEEVMPTSRHKLYMHEDCVGTPVKNSKINAYVAKYGYDRERQSAPALTFAQLNAKLVKEGLKPDALEVSLPVSSRVSSAPVLASVDARTPVSKPASSPRVTPAKPTPAKAAPAVKAPTARPSSRVTAVPPAGRDQFSETALAGRPRAQVKEIPEQPVPSPKPTEPAKPKDLRCSICGKAIAAEADAYIPPEKSRGPVHKHSPCAYKYFSRFYSVDNTSLESYDAFYFLNEPSGVTAAKGLMKKLGLTPKEVKSYAQSAREATRAEAERQRQMQERSKKWSELKAAYESACAVAYVKVTQADKEKYVYKNRVVLNSIRRKQKENKKLTKKEKLVWQNYQNLLVNEGKQKKCEEAAKAFKAFTSK
uniref:Peptidase M43 pregnancy-associated plasma-A domain-containing protein n=1 Tax=uncultured Elusimicrobia bacterium TaxID=699876 RepID=A0A650EM64_9BACT|nr:hypothetical protein Elusimicrob1349_0020 [uncultured Elusimicrobia bacterium]